MEKYSLSIVLFIFFLVSIIGQAYFQYSHELKEAESNNQTLTTEDFTNSFIASTLENWQSEFLQLFTFVILSTFLIHKGSPQSKDGDEEVERTLKRIEEKISKNNKSKK